MELKIECQKCSARFEPLSTPFADMIRRFAKAGYVDLGVECPKCGKYTNFNPTAYMAGKSATVAAAPYRCPVSCCAGFVSQIEDDDEGQYWGCGECGSIWYEQQKMLDEITEIVKRFKYRRKSYRKSRGKWFPGDIEKEVGGYEDRVYEEPEDESDEYVRG